jgi:hypothetical protein
METQTATIGDLPRKLGMLDATVMVIGIVIGSGIFVLPNLIARNLPSRLAILSVWIISGALSFFGALAYAELGAMMPATGGLYVYLREAYGPLWAFVSGWTFMLAVLSGGTAWLTVTFSIYAGQFVPLTPVTSKVVSLALLAILSIVNLIGVREGAWVQRTFTILKIAGLIVLIGSAMLTSGSVIKPLGTAAAQPQFSLAHCCRRNKGPQAEFAALTRYRDGGCRGSLRFCECRVYEGHDHFRNCRIGACGRGDGYADHGRHRRKVRVIYSVVVDSGRGQRMHHRGCPHPIRASQGRAFLLAIRPPSPAISNARILHRHGWRLDRRAHSQRFLRNTLFIRNSRRLDLLHIERPRCTGLSPTDAGRGPALQNVGLPLHALGVRHRVGLVHSEFRGHAAQAFSHGTGDDRRWCGRVSDLAQSDARFSHRKSDHPC